MPPKNANKRSPFVCFFTYCIKPSLYYLILNSARTGRARLEQLQASSNPVDLLVRRGPYGGARNRPRLQLCASRICYFGPWQPGVSRGGYDAVKFAEAGNFDYNLCLVYHPCIVPVRIAPSNAFGSHHAGVPYLGGNLALSHLEISPYCYYLLHAAETILANMCLMAGHDSALRAMLHDWMHSQNRYLPQCRRSPAMQAHHDQSAARFVPIAYDQATFLHESCRTAVRPEAWHSHDGSDTRPINSIVSLSSSCMMNMKG